MKINPTRVLAVIGAALVLMVGGAFAYAAIPSANGTISACVNTSSGTIRLIDAEAGATCKKGEQAVTWNQGGGVSGYEKVTRTEHFSPGTGAAGGFSVMATCPPGKVVTGGGGHFLDEDGSPSTFNTFIVNATFPNADNTGWVTTLTGSNLDSLGVVGIQAYALCAAAS